MEQEPQVEAEQPLGTMGDAEAPGCSQPQACMGRVVLVMLDKCLSNTDAAQKRKG